MPTWGLDTLPSQRVPQKILQDLLHEEVVVDSSDMEVINRDAIEELVDTKSNEVVEEISEEVTNETTTEKIVAEGDD